MGRGIVISRRLDHTVIVKRDGADTYTHTQHGVIVKNIIKRKFAYTG